MAFSIGKDSELLASFKEIKTNVNEASLASYYLGISEIEIQRILEDYATKEYVEEYGGKIDSISVGGTAMKIDENKNVDIDNLIFDCGTSTTNI